MSNIELSSTPNAPAPPWVGWCVAAISPGAVDRGKTQLDAAGNYMMAQIFKDGKMTSANAVNVAGAQGMEYFFQGRLGEKNTGEVRLRIFVVRGYLYKIIFLGLNAGSNKSPLVQTVFDSFALKPEPSTK